jgi:hypothetical protein
MFPCECLYSSYSPYRTLVSIQMAGVGKRKAVDEQPGGVEAVPPPPDKKTSMVITILRCYSCGTMGQKGVMCSGACTNYHCLTCTTVCSGIERMGCTARFCIDDTRPVCVHCIDVPKCEGCGVRHRKLVKCRHKPNDDGTGGTTCDKKYCMRYVKRCIVCTSRFTYPCTPGRESSIVRCEACNT